MRIVSYNILEGGTGRADPIAEVILAQRSDIVCLVETQDPAVVERIASRLDMDFFRAGDERQSATILSRWTIRETIDHAARFDEISKSLLEATIVEPGGREWVMGVVHLHAGAYEDDERKRERELAVILEQFGRHRRASRPHLLAGDFNSNAPYQRIDPAKCKPSTRKAWEANGGQIPRRVVQRLLDAGYTDTLRAADEQSGATDVSFTTLHPGERVDYVFAFGFDQRAVSSAWIENDRLAKYASDHFPVGAEMRFPLPARGEG
jgi:endonuclease/exonuclease/phosphatase family metal-dependent hydrolase